MSVGIEGVFKMLFKVYAGSIFCGVLQVYPSSGEHRFIDLRSSMIWGAGVISRVKEYKRLSLRRVL